MATGSDPAGFRPEPWRTLGRVLFAFWVAAESTSPLRRAFTTLCYSADGQSILAGGMSKFVCIYHVKEQILRKKFEISCNLSLDAMEVSECCKAAEQGPGAARDPCVVPAANARGCPALPMARLTPRLHGDLGGGGPLDRCACPGSPALAPLPGEGHLRAAVSPPPWVFRGGLSWSCPRGRAAGRAVAGGSRRHPTCGSLAGSRALFVRLSG